MLIAAKPYSFQQSGKEKGVKKGAGVVEEPSREEE